MSSGLLVAGEGRRRRIALGDAIVRNVDSGSAQLTCEAVFPGAVWINGYIDEPGNVGRLLDA